MLSVVKLNDIMLRVIKLNVVMLNVVMVNVVMLNLVMVNVVVPNVQIRCCVFKPFFFATDGEQNKLVRLFKFFYVGLILARKT